MNEAKRRAVMASMRERGIIVDKRKGTEQEQR